MWNQSNPSPSYFKGLLRGPHEINHIMKVSDMTVHFFQTNWGIQLLDEKMRDYKVFLFSYLPGDCLNLAFILPARSATKKFLGARRNKEEVWSGSLWPTKTGVFPWNFLERTPWWLKPQFNHLFSPASAILALLSSLLVLGGLPFTGWLKIVHVYTREQVKPFPQLLR